jgi:hypothetical protein
MDEIEHSSNIVRTTNQAISLGVDGMNLHEPMFMKVKGPYFSQFFRDVNYNQNNDNTQLLIVFGYLQNWIPVASEVPVASLNLSDTVSMGVLDLDIPNH